MPAIDATLDRAARARALLMLALLALVLTLARLAYLAWLSPYELSEDEAFYWEWALRPDWSYATKGPGIAWSIWLAVRALGDTELAIRSVAAVSAGVATLAVGGLAHDVAGAMARAGGETVADACARARRTGVWAALLFNLAPVFQGTALLCTIDGPYLACWAVSVWAGWRALACASRGAWIALGLAIGAGFLFKYTILLLPPGLLLFAWLYRARLRMSRGWALWLGAGALFALLGLLPVAVWNSQHDWQTVRHLLGHLGVQGGDVQVVRAPGAVQGPAFPLQWTLELVATQLGLLVPIVPALVAGVIWCVRRGGAPVAGVFARSQATGYLLLCAAPVLLFYLLVTLQTEAEANWPIAGYITLLPVGALWLTQRHEPAALLRLARRAAVIGGLISALVLHRMDWARGALSVISPKVGAALPVQRLIGGRAMAQDVARRAGELRARTGLEPLLMVEHYGQASRIRFYLPRSPGELPPVVYAVQSRAGGRKVQHDFWADTNLDAPELRGRPGVLVGGPADGAIWLRAFEKVEARGPLSGETKANRPSFDGIGYTGFAPAPAR